MTPIRPDPVDPDRPRLLSKAFWMMMAFAFACVAAAVVVAVFGPRLFGPPPSARAGPTLPAVIIRPSAASL